MPYRITVTEIKPGKSDSLNGGETLVTYPDREREIYRRERDELDLHAVIIAVDGLDRLPEKTQA